MSSCSLPHHKADEGKGRRKRGEEKKKRGKKPCSHLQQKQLGGPERKRSPQSPRVQERSTPTCPGKGCPEPGGQEVTTGGEKGRVKTAPPKAPFKPVTACHGPNCHAQPRGSAFTRSLRFSFLAVPSPGSAEREEEEKVAEEDTKRRSTGPLTQKMTLKPKMKYLMQQLTSGPL